MNKYILYAIILVLMIIIVVLVFVVYREDVSRALEDTATGDVFFPPQFENRTQKEQLDMLMRDNQPALSEEERAQRTQVLDSLRADSPGTLDPVQAQANISSTTTATTSDTNTQAQQIDPQSGARTQEDIERLRLLDQMAQ